MGEIRFNLAQQLIAQQTQLSALEAMEAVAFAASHLGARIGNEWMDARPGAVVRPPLQNVRDLVILGETLGFGLGAQFAGRPGSHLQQAGKIAILTGMSPTLDIMWNAGQHYFNQTPAARTRNNRSSSRSYSSGSGGNRPTIEIISGPNGTSSSSRSSSGGSSGGNYW